MKKPNTDTVDKKIEALKQYKILDTLPEKEYDDITRLAAYICNTPIALVSFLDDKRQFFKSHHGLKTKEIPIEHSFCIHAIKKTNDVFIVEDANKDKRFGNNPLVISKPNIIFYAGVSLLTEEGIPLGTLSVLDSQPNKLNSEQILLLQALANQVMQLLVLRRKKNETDESKSLIDQKAESLNNVIEATRIGTWEWNFETGEIKINERWANIIGYTLTELQLVNEKTIYKFIHPDDIALSDKKVKECLDKEIVFYDVDFRLKHKNGNYIWVNDKGRVVKWSSDGKPLLMTGTHTDITERKVAEKRLKLSEQRFKDLVQEGSDLIGILTVEGVYLYVSPTSTTVLGITPEEFVGKNAFDFIHPDDKERVLNSFSSIPELNKVEISPFRFANKKGDWRWVETVATNMLKNPAIEGIVTNSRDVTERVEANEKIRKSEQRFKALIQEGADLVTIISPEGDYSYISPNYKTLLGYTDKDLIGNNAFNFFHPDDLELLQKEFNQLVKNRRVKSSPYRFKRKDGSWCWLQSVGTNLVEDQAIGGIVINSVDITSLVNVQEELEISNERFELVNKATNDAIYDWDVEKDEFYWGEGFYNMLGYDKTDEIFRLNDWVELTHPIDRLKHQQSWESFLKDERRQKWMNEFRFRKVDGTYIHIEEIGYMLRDKNGKPVRMIGALRNVSKSKLSETQKQIQHQVASIFKEENELKVILESTLKYIVDFGEFQTAEVWLISSDKKQLNLSSVYATDNKVKPYLNHTKEIKRLKLGEGLPGKVWKDLQVNVWKDISTSPKFIRNTSAKKSGLKSGIGFPLFHNATPVGVMVLTSKESLKHDSYRIETFSPLSNFLGAEIKRKQQEEELKLFFNSAPDILAIASPDGHFVKTNPAFTKILGYTAEEIISQPFENFLHPDDIKSTIKEYNETITGDRKAQGFTNRYRTKSGIYKWIAWNSSDVYGENGYVFSYGRDVTEMKELQQLLENTSRLAKVGSWEIDVKQNSVYWSGITKEIREVASDFKPTLSKGMSGFVDGDKDIIKKRVEQCKKDGTPWDEELRIITEKGNLKWIRTIGRAEFIEGECVKIYGSFQDIHEQKLNEIALKKSLKTLEDYKFSLDQSAIIAFTDKTGVITSVNDNFCKISQYSKEELIGKTHKLINSNYHPKPFFVNLWKTIASGKVWRGEIKNLAKDGSYYWVDTTIVPFLDEKNKPFQYLAIRFEITDRKSADEKAIKALEERNTILESIGDAFFALDRDFTVTYWNRIAENITNTPREKIIGENLWDLFSKEEGKISFKNYTRAMKNMETIHFEDYHAPLDKWFDLSVYPTKGGLAVYMKDVTERKAAEEQIRQSNSRFEKVTEATNDAIWDWDIINNQLYWGKGYSTLFGYDVINKTPDLKSWKSRIHPDDGNTILKSLDNIIKDSNSINWQHEYRYKKENGEYTFVIDRGVVIRDEKGKAIRMVGAMTDISYQKEHEESLKKLNNQLLKYTNELVRSNEELEQFAYVASHDLQEPLRMVISFLSQLEKKYSDQLDEKAHIYINFAVDGASRMRNIILDLLEYSRVGKNNDELESVDTTEIVEQANVLLRKIVEEKNATIIYKDLPTIMAYRSPIVQVFQNLISNGLKYAKADVAPIIQVKAKELKSEWQFAIKDNGIGIKKDYYDKIFVIFQRLHNKDEYTGTGMGLAIVKKIVENFGGKIWLESEEGKGSTFYFTLPK